VRQQHRRPNRRRFGRDQLVVATRRRTEDRSYYDCRLSLRRRHPAERRISPRHHQHTGTSQRQHAAHRQPQSLRHFDRRLDARHQSLAPVVRHRTRRLRRGRQSELPERLAHRLAAESARPGRRPLLRHLPTSRVPDPSPTARRCRHDRHLLGQLAARRILGYVLPVRRLHVFPVAEYVLPISVVLGVRQRVRVHSAGDDRSHSTDHRLRTHLSTGESRMTSLIV